MISELCFSQSIDCFFFMCHPGFENNFEKVSEASSTTNGVPYDYMSVMHYGKNAFSNGNGSTIITKDPQFQDVIGQRLEMSPSDVRELNLLYKCSKCLLFWSLQGPTQSFRNALGLFVFMTKICQISASVKVFIALF